MQKKKIANTIKFKVEKPHYEEKTSKTNLIRTSTNNNDKWYTTCFL